MQALAYRDAEIGASTAVCRAIAGAYECPFDALGMGSTEIDEYLSDATERLQRGGMWQERITEQIESIAIAARADVELTSIIHSIQAHTQEMMKGKIVDYRDNIQRFAATLVECISFSQAGDRDIAVTCEWELQELLKQNKKIFKITRNKMTAMIQEHNCATQEHMKSSTTSEGQLMLYNTLSRVSTLFCLTFAGITAVGAYSPEFLSKISITDRWYVAVVRKGDGLLFDKTTKGQVKLHRGSLMQPSAIAAVTFGLLGLFRWYATCHAKDQKRLADLARVNEITQHLAHQNNSMWDGMNMWVEDVAKSIEILQGLQPERVEMRRAQLRNIAGKLFGMSMAVDEYIFWLHKRNFFPANFSVRNFLTPKRYDRIKSMVEDVS